MRKITLLIVVLLQAVFAFSQKHTLSFGAGPAASVYFWTGGRVQTWASPNLQNIRPQRRNLGPSFTLQYNKQKKKNFEFFTSLSYDSYGIKFKKTFQHNDMLILTDTRESYKTVFLSFGLEKKIKIKDWELYPGVGLNMYYYFRQDIDLGYKITNLNPGGGFIMNVTNWWGNAAGTQLGLRVMHPVNKYMKLGIQPLYCLYLPSLEGEKASVNFFCSVGF